MPCAGAHPPAGNRQADIPADTWPAFLDQKRGCHPAKKKIIQQVEVVKISPELQQSC